MHIKHTAVTLNGNDCDRSVAGDLSAARQPCICMYSLQLKCDEHMEMSTDSNRSRIYTYSTSLESRISETQTNKVVRSSCKAN